MHQDRAVVVAGVLAHAPLEGVEHDVEAEVAVDVDVELVAGVPVELGRRADLLRRRDPLALVAVGVSPLHLHELREDRPVGEELDLVGQERDLARWARR